MSLKFNIGDKVIQVRNLEYIKNPYHSAKAMYINTVEQANDKYFTTDKFTKIEGFIPGMDHCMINIQPSGRAWYGDRHMLHIVKDRDIIVDMVNAIIDPFIIESRIENDLEIKNLRARIKILKIQGSSCYALSSKIKEVFCNEQRNKFFSMLQIEETSCKQ